MHIALEMLHLAVLGDRHAARTNGCSVHNSLAKRHRKIPQSSQSLFLAVSAVPVPD